MNATDTHHEFVYRSDFDQCSVCGGTHGKDPFAIEDQRDALRIALDSLTAKLMAIDASESLNAVFAIARVHGCKYTGPNWNEALAVALAVLAASR
jgi:hypothetical protein